MSDCDLKEAGVLITRAAHQAGLLCRLIEQYNGKPLRLPAIEIVQTRQPALVEATLSAIDTYDIVVFVSANAVVRGLPYLSDGRLPDNLQIAAVGLATAQALAEAGYPVDVVPEGGFNSEALLEAPELQRVAGKRILIFRGEGGRPLLGDTLAERGATVEYAEVYRRCCPEIDSGLAFLPWLADLDVVTATSNEILNNLFLLFGDNGRVRLQQTPLVVVSSRMRDHARALGCGQVMLADGPDDNSIVEALCRWAPHR